MDNKNNAFQEEYKRLDGLCKDLFSDAGGVSEYIRQMESVSYADQRYYADWVADYRQLKHLRWVRNQLAHEVGTLEEDFCTDAEIAWLRDFHQKILDVCDPLSVVRRAKQKAEQQVKQYREYRTNPSAVPAAEENAGQKEPENGVQRMKKQESGWAKFIAKMKKFFSK